ncbi:MAG: hypothetical protein ACRDTK_05250 [Mycobacterium sp.]
MTLPPRQVPFALAGSHPELQVLPTAPASIVHDLIQGTPGFVTLVSAIQQQGPPAADSGWARLEPIVLTGGIPAKNSAGDPISRLWLTGETLIALTPVIDAALASALADARLKGVLWAVQEGLAPGQESGGAAAPKWSLAPFLTLAGVAFPAAGYDGTTRQLSLDCLGVLPRHLAVYAEFLSAGQPVAPAGWHSRLPPGVPQTLETATQKYLGVLAPNVAVAGLSLPTAPQAVGVTLPAGTDSVRLALGGLGSDGWTAVPDAAGVMLSFVLDYALPAIIAAAGADAIASASAGWYQQIVADADVRAQVIAAAARLLAENAIMDTATLLAWLAEEVATLFLDDDLAGLRATIDAEFGTDTVANAAPSLGWAAQTLAATFASPAPAYSPLGAAPATQSLALAPDTAVTIEAVVVPDALRGDWPDAAQSYELVATYADGYVQRQGGALDLDPAGAQIAASFPSVRTGAPITLTATVSDAAAKLMSGGTVTLPAVPTALGGAVRATVQVLDEPVVITAATRFARRRTLSYTPGGGYAWIPAVTGSTTTTKQSLNCSPGTNSLCELVGITLQPATRSLGYTWRTTDSGVPECASGSPVAESYSFQNVGVLDPAAMLKQITCGFAGQPHLAYAAADAVYLDPRVPRPALRPVSLGAPGPFDLGAQGSRGCFRAPDLSAVALHPAGYAIGVSATGSRVEIVALSPVPVADADAPAARVVAGAGTRAGLVGAPVGCAVAPDGSVLVLDGANARIQAFDIEGNPVPVFEGSPLAPLRAETGAEYQDIAVSAAGLIYILSNVNGGSQPSDYRLDAYSADGSFLTRTTGVNAARIVVDSAERVYTLDYTAIKAAGGRTQPVVSQWSPV